MGCNGAWWCGGGEPAWLERDIVKEVDAEDTDVVGVLLADARSQLVVTRARRARRLEALVQRGALLVDQLRVR